MNSGRLVILGILTVALASAAASWWFRYNATHRAADFWGPHATRLIRDAPHVYFHEITPLVDSKDLAEAKDGIDVFVNSAARPDISTARGLVHLRSALLEDRSFDWPPKPASHDVQWHWALIFSADSATEGTILLFSTDWQFVASVEKPDQLLSCRPIADGLRQMLGDIATKTTAKRDSTASTARDIAWTQAARPL